jgi:hypothetical protein
MAVVAGLLLPLGTALAAIGIWHYVADVRVVAATLVAIEPAAPGAQVAALKIAVQSNVPAWQSLPAGMRTLFFLLPQLCLVDRAGTLIENGAFGTVCYPAEDDGGARDTPQASERAIFLLPLPITTNTPNHELALLNLIRQQHGIWIRIKWVGFMLPPPVLSAPIWVALPKPLVSPYLVR